MTRVPSISGQKDRLASHVVNMLGARGIYALSKWAAIACMAKLGSASMVGQYGLGIAIALPVFGLTDLQLRSVQATDARHEQPFSLYLGLRIITIALAVLVMIAIAISSYDALQAQVIMLVGLFKASESLADICYGALQQHEKMNRMAMSIILRSVLATAGLIGALLWNPMALRLGLVLMLVMSLLVCFCYDLPQVAKLRGPDGSPASIRPVFPPRKLVSLAWLSLPLGLVMMLWMLQFNLPRYMLEAHHGQAALGVFAGIVYFMDAGMQFIVSIGNTFSPRLARAYAQSRKRDFLKLFAIFTTLCITLGLTGLLVVWLAGPWILRLLLSEEYAEHHGLFMIVMLASVLMFASSAAGFTMTATRWFRSSLVPALVGSVLSLIVSAILIPRHGLIGAGWTLVFLAGVAWLLPLGVIAVALRRGPAAPASPTPDPSLEKAPA